jgi:predicted alpha-1,6-mannanase (GH76 family)
MVMPSADTPLYNHPLPDIEQWLREQGCHQDPQSLNEWHLEKADWQADVMLDVDSLVVRYLKVAPKGEDIQRIFKYSLSRQDLEEAIFSGP